MKILYLNPAANLGGGERSLLDMIRTIRQTAPEVELHLLVTDDGPLIEQARELGIKVDLLPLPRELAELGDSGFSFKKAPLKTISFLLRSFQSLVALWNYTQQLRNTIELIKPNVIHSNGFKTHLLVSFINPDIPIIWHIRDFVSSRQIVSRLLQLASSRVTMAIANSQAVSRDLQKVLPKRPVKVVYNAIDTDYFFPVDRLAASSGQGGDNGLLLDDLASLPPAPMGTLRIGLIATFARWKGQAVFLEAASQILKTHPDLKLRFYIVGGAIYQTKDSQFSLSELQSISKSLGIGDLVGFTGFQENTADIYRALDIVVHASTQPEPFGRTIVEAMACGKPVIVSQAGGAAELFTHNYDAVGVPPGEPFALAAAILDLLNNPEKRRVISERARQTAIDRFNQERLGEQLMEVYNQVLDSQ